MQPIAIDLQGGLIPGHWGTSGLEPETGRICDMSLKNKRVGYFYDEELSASFLSYTHSPVVLGHKKLQGPSSNVLISPKS